MTTTPETMTYNELKAHYVAVRKRLGGLGKSAGLVPIRRVEVAPVLPPVEPEIKTPEPEPEIIFRVDTIPKNKFNELLITVARKHQIDPNKLVSSTRKIGVVRIRREVVWHAVKDLKYSLSQVGRWLRKDHTTIHHDIQMYEKQINHVSAA